MLIPPPEPSVEGSDESMPKEPQALIDLQIEMGRKIDDSQEKNDFFSKLAEDHPKHLATHVARLDVLPESATYTTVAEASSAILNLVNQTRLAEYFGTSPPEKLTASQARRDKEAKAERDALCLAYQRRTNALLHRDRASSLSSSDQSYDAALSEDDTNGKEGKTAESLLDVWKSWAQDKDDPKIALASARCHLADGRTGTALTILQGLFAKCGNEESTIVFEARELSTEALFALGWQVVLDVQRRAELVRAPPQGYAPW